MTKSTFRYSNRWGRFRVTSILLTCLHDGPIAKGLMALFGKMIVIRANDCPCRDEVEYWAISDLFEPVEEGDSIPFYQFEWLMPAEKGGEIQLKAWKVEDAPKERW